MSQGLVFGCEASSPRGLREAALLAASLRAFGGAFAGSPFWVLVRHPDDVASEAACRLAEARAEVAAYPADEAAAAFPFTARLLAAAHAEVLAEERGSQLVWMDSGSLVLREPGALVLPPGKALGCRPVDHANIGSPWEEPADAFWQLIYDRCGVMAGRVYPVAGSVDGRLIRPYFNVGLLAVGPGAGLLRRWKDDFGRVCRDPAFDALYAERPLRRVFVHQAALSATALALLGRPAIRQLPPAVNYPLHMHGEAAAAGRAASADELVTCRYEDLLEAPGGRRLPLPAHVIEWLEGRVEAPRGAARNRA